MISDTINMASSIMPLADSRANAVVGLSTGEALYRDLHAAATESSADKARNAATSFVASALLMPILGTLHESPFELKPPFAPGVAEKRFAPMLDQHLSDRIAKASNFDLVDAIVKRFVPASYPQKDLFPLNPKKEFIDVRA